MGGRECRSRNVDYVGDRAQQMAHTPLTGTPGRGGGRGSRGLRERGGIVGRKCASSFSRNKRTIIEHPDRSATVSPARAPPPSSPRSTGERGKDRREMPAGTVGMNIAMTT